MNNKQLNPPPAGTFSIGDIYQILFRHKWKIMFLSLLGLGGAAAWYVTHPVAYQSQAKLFIRYVVENKSPGQLDPTDARIKTTDQRGENVINTEVEILTSLDLAQEVAETIGPDRLLGPDHPLPDRFSAGSLIQQSLTVEAPRRSDVLTITFKHRDPSIVQPVLKALIDAYYQRHAEIHRSVGMFNEFLTRETDDLRSRLLRTEGELRRARTNAGIISLEDSKKTFSDQLARISQSLLDAEAELAERRAAAAELSRILAVRPAVTTTNETTVVTNEIPVVPSNVIGDYTRLRNLIDTLRKREQELLLQFTPESSLVKSLTEQITWNEKLKQQLETDHPGLLAVAPARTTTSPGAPATATGGPQLDLTTELARIAALASKIKVLNEQLERVRLDASRIDEVEGSITSLQRTKELQESHYKYFEASLEQARINEALGAGRVSNISEIQAPSPPGRDNLPLYKVMAGIAGGAIALALLLAFAIETYLDRSLKRPVDIENKLGLDLFLNIPRISRNGHMAALNGTGLKQLEWKSGAGTATVEPQESGKHLVKWDPRDVLRDFHDALRDRLVTFFEVKNLTHKPKLVAITSCGHGSGVTTTAAGLAASLSETGDGNVLLVDMNQEGAAHQFYKGKLACGIDDALEAETRDHTQVNENLYVVSEAANALKLPRVMPKRFTHLVPKLKASDYDYIIFDMPPVTQISITPRLAKFMDMVVMVVESEKTDRDVVRKAADLIRQNQPHVGVVLNKTRTYVPRMLQQEL